MTKTTKCHNEIYRINKIYKHVKYGNVFTFHVYSRLRTSAVATAVTRDSPHGAAGGWPAYAAQLQLQYHQWSMGEGDPPLRAYA